MRLLEDMLTSTVSVNRMLPESGHSHAGNESSETRLASPPWHHDYEAHPNSSSFGHAIRRHKK